MDQRTSPTSLHVTHRSTRNDDARSELRQLFQLHESRDPSTAFIFQQQLMEIVRGAPFGIALNALTGLVFAIEVRHSIAVDELLSWVALLLSCNVARAISNARIRRRLACGTPQAEAIAEISCLVALTSLCWLIPVFAWSPLLPDHHRVLLGLVILGIMGGGGSSLGSVPPAAMTLIAILTVGEMRMSLYHHSWIVVGLVVAMTLALSNGAISGGRLFVRHIRARYELEEQGQLISLLREFQSSGSEWLWELDEEGKILYMSRGMAEAIGQPIEKLLGRNIRSLIDPNERYRRYSEGIRLLLRHFDEGSDFHEIALPAVDGRRWFSLSGRPVLAEDGRLVAWRGVASDISGLRVGAGTEGVRVARRDPLTGLANRLMVREMLEETHLRELRGDAPCVFLLLDLDRFKLVNDSLGHAAGDRLLIEVSRRLERACGDAGSVGRIGGDEFAIIWRGAADTMTLLDLADRIMAAVDQPFMIGSSAVHVGVSIGIARAATDGGCEDELMQSADLALYRSKERGRGCCTFYEPWMLAKAQAERLLESDVRDAVRQGELRLHYQPIVDAATHATVGHEALLRWSHPRRGAIGPDVFVPIIEDVGLIHQIGDWVIREACSEASRWPRGTRIAVNISATQLTGTGLRQTVEEALADSGLDPANLELEMTENIFLGDDATTLAALASLQALGVRLVLDDFGKGYSSFGYLSRACFAKIKIDQMFVRGAADGRRDCVAIIKAILALARGMDVETTAEGIETIGQAELLTHLGCTQLQGYLFGKPVSATVLLEYLSQQAATVEAPLRRRA